MDTIEKSIIEQINLLHGELEGIVKTGLQKAIQIGGLLSECKTKLPHGEFAPWIETNCRFSVRTGQNYMKLHDNRDKLTDTHSLTQAYRLLKNETVSHLKEIDGMSAADWIRVRWLQQLYGIHPGISLTPTSLELPDDLPYEAWVKIGELLGACPFKSVA